MRGPKGQSTQGVGSTRQVGESEDPWANAFMGVGWNTQAKGMKGFHWYVWMSPGHYQGRARRECVSGANLIILVHLVTWMGCSQPVHGDAEATGKQEDLNFTLPVSVLLEDGWWTQGTSCLPRDGLMGMFDVLIGWKARVISALHLRVSVNFWKLQGYLNNTPFLWEAEIEMAAQVPRGSWRASLMVGVLWFEETLGQSVGLVLLEQDTSNRGGCSKHRSTFLINRHCLDAGIGGSNGKESACKEGDLGSIPDLGRSPGGRHWQPTLEFLPGESPWTEEPGGLQSMESQRVGHDWVTKHTAQYAIKRIYKELAILWTRPDTGQVLSTY